MGCQAGFRKGKGTRGQIADIHWIIEKAREFWENIYFCFIDCTNAFDCVYHNKLWKILKEMGISRHLTCLLRNLCERTRLKRLSSSSSHPEKGAVVSTGGGRWAERQHLYHGLPSMPLFITFS